MLYIVDTRNQKDGFVVKSLEALGHMVCREKLPFGDIIEGTNLLHAIDLKSSGGGLVELAKNRCSKDRERMKREIRKCAEMGGEISFLCFEPGITCIDDVEHWQVPTYKTTAYKYGKIVHEKGQPYTAVKPLTLMRSLKTMTEPNHYVKEFELKRDFTVGLEFTTEQACGEKIVQIFKDMRYRVSLEKEKIELPRVVTSRKKKPKFRIEDFSDSIEYVMICLTDEEIQTFRQHLDDLGRTWSSGARYTDPLHKDENGYIFNLGYYCSHIKSLKYEKVICNGETKEETKRILFEDFKKVDYEHIPLFFNDFDWT